MTYSELVTWCNDNCSHEEKATNTDDLNKDNKAIYSPELHPKAILIQWICLGRFNTVIFMVCIGKKSGDAPIPHATENAEQYAAICCSYSRV